MTLEVKTPCGLKWYLAAKAKLLSLQYFANIRRTTLSLHNTVVVVVVVVVVVMNAYLPILINSAHPVTAEIEDLAWTRRAVRSDSYKDITKDKRIRTNACSAARRAFSIDSECKSRIRIEFDYYGPQMAQLCCRCCGIWLYESGALIRVISGVSCVARPNAVCIGASRAITSMPNAYESRHRRKLTHPQPRNRFPVWGMKQAGN